MSAALPGKRLPHAVAALFLAAIAGCASAPPAPSAAARAELAPTGKFRVAFVTLNALVVRQDPATGEFRGMAVELGREIAARLGVPFAPVGYGNVIALNESRGVRDWDVAIRAFTPERAKALDFTPVFMQVPTTFLVPASSPLQRVGDVDRPGVRIVFPAQSSIDHFFRRNPPKHAVVERTDGLQPAIDMINFGQADAFAQNREILAVSAGQIPGARILDGGFSTLQLAFAVPKGRTAATAYLSEVVEHLKASGFIREAMARSGLKGALVAPPAAGP